MEQQHLTRELAHHLEEIHLEVLGHLGELLVVDSDLVEVQGDLVQISRSMISSKLSEVSNREEGDRAEDHLSNKKKF
jgi:hypothetical protein